jgi:CPA1 family monovalent cation:H+ antiporter
MREIELVLGLLVAVAALAMLAHRLRVPYPIVLVLGGLLIGFVPGLPDVQLAPDLVFLLFLPPLLCISAFYTSVRDFRANARPILSLAIGLVVDHDRRGRGSRSRGCPGPGLAGGVRAGRHRLAAGRRSRDGNPPTIASAARHRDRARWRELAQ